MLNSVNPHLTLVTFVPLARRALQTAEPVVICGSGHCYGKHWERTDEAIAPNDHDFLQHTHSKSWDQRNDPSTRQLRRLVPVRPICLISDRHFRLAASRPAGARPPPYASAAMNLTNTETHPLYGKHFLHNLPMHLPRDKPGFVNRNAHNLYRKAVHAGKWQNFAAGIGTGAAYSSLHGLHWHPHWLTIIEYVFLLEPLPTLSLSRLIVPHRLILFFTNVAIFSINLILLTTNILGVCPLVYLNSE